MAKLAGKVAIVTGAGLSDPATDHSDLNIGAATALLYASHGASVVVADLTQDAVDHTLDLLRQEGFDGLGCVLNIASHADCRHAVEKCLTTFGRLDIVQNNAGAGWMRHGTLLSYDEALFDLNFSVNVKGLFNMCAAAAPVMAERGGAILNISSVAAVLTQKWPELMIYNVSKAAVNAATKAFAYELASKGIRVNAIMPGSVRTAGNLKYARLHYGEQGKEIIEEAWSKIPIGRAAEPMDIAQASLFLVSDEAKYITGQIIAVDGGLSC